VEDCPLKGRKSLTAGSTVLTDRLADNSKVVENSPVNLKPLANPVFFVYWAGFCFLEGNICEGSSFKWRSW
jgi:hypothetical protein